MKRLLAISLLLVGAACSSAPKTEKTSGNVVIVQIDEVTLGSRDKNLHQYPLPASMIVAVADKLKKAGAKVVVVDMGGQQDPTTVAISAVQEYTGKFIEPSSVPRDDKGQMKAELPQDHVVQVKSERGPLVQEHVPSFARAISFSDAYHESIEKLRPAVQGKIVYVGCTACSGGKDAVVAGKAADYPALFADAHLADQLLLSDAVTGKSSSN